MIFYHIGCALDYYCPSFFFLHFGSDEQHSIYIFVIGVPICFCFLNPSIFNHLNKHFISKDPKDMFFPTI